jgi:superfamily II DNA or RNA helicase
MAQIVLRPDQQSLKDATYNDWSNGVQNTLAVLSTGGGKSVIASDIVLDGARTGLQQVVMAHRNELVSQLSGHIANRGIPHRIIGSDTTIAQIRRQHYEEYGRSFINPSAETAVAGVDTLVARKEVLKDWLHQTDRWIGDEAHHFLRENKWGKAVDLMPNAKGLGVTATPLRADGMGLGRHADGVFDSMNVGLHMRQLIINGALAEYEIVCPKSDIEIDHESTAKNGDWSPQKLKAAAKKSHIVGDVVEAYCQHAYGKQAIVFATDVETAGEIARKFNDSGIKAVALSGNTNSTVREKYIKEFRAGKLQVLVNVDLFDEGFDVPACEVVIMARPTASLGKYRQMVGRCLRTADGKLYGLIIDHVSNVIRHGLPDKIIHWTLDRRDKRGRQEKDPEEILLTVCKNKGCAKPYEAFRLICPYCGKAPPPPKPQDRTLEKVSGDLVLLDRETLENMRQATEIETPGEMASRAPNSKGDMIARGLANRQVEKIDAHDRLKEAIAQWAALQRIKNLEDREIHKKFYLTTGFDVVSALDASKTRKEIETIAERVEGWCV